MSREILFRAKRIDNGNWFCGYYARHERRQPGAIGDALRPEEIKHLMMYNGFADWNMPRSLCCIEIDPETVGQFIGLYDADGNRIFEGDIIKGKRKELYVIEYNAGTGAFRARELSKTPYVPCLTLGTMNHYRVVGNRWDNPELMGKEG